MQGIIILKTLGLLLTLFSSSMLLPIIISFSFHEGHHFPFVVAFLITLGTGLLLWLPTRKYHYEFKTRDGFLIVVLLWVVLSLFAALPFIISHHIYGSITDAIFEATSGLTTTGASVLTGLDYLPKSLLFYRQLLQFLGGMGIIVLAVAILPMLGVGGMQLYRAEIPGPVKDSKLTPRIAETAKTLWYIYFGLTFLCAISYWATGMTFFDAVGESFSTVATGGFSVHDASFAHYDNAGIELIASLFMFLGGVNFTLHFIALQRTSIQHYFLNQEFRAFVIILLSGIIITFVFLKYTHFYPENFQALIKSIFNVVSLTTTTGFESARFHLWPSFLPFLLMFMALFGACAGSTCGGVKIIRLLLLQKQAFRELKRLIHPTSVLPLKFGDQILPERVIQSMWGFIATFNLLFIILMLVVMALGNDFTTAFATMVATLSNAGNAVGGVSETFAHLSTPTKWVLILSMLAGRLEIFTLLVLCMPSFWKK